MSGATDLSTELLHSIEEALNWASGEARTSASYCTLASDTKALEDRAESLDDLVAEVQGVLRARQDAQKGGDA